MESELINGDRALAWGAIEASVSVVTSYPGSPGTGVFNALQETEGTHGHRTEWCSNERVALDIAAGVSQGGKRSLVCLKSVGMNVALDTLMVLNMTGVHAGLVILLGDDPSAWGSQNEQDTRPVANLAELPLLEPSGLEEGREMLRWAFDFSERHRIVVIVRITRSFCAQKGEVRSLEPPSERTRMTPDREPMRWISSPMNSVENHRRLHDTLSAVAADFEKVPYNVVEGSGGRGILAGGFAHAKLMDALGGSVPEELSVLKLSSLYPLPKDVVAGFLEHCDEVLVLEEVDPFLEDAIKMVGYDAGTTTPIRGKRTGDSSWEGELFRWQIQNSLDRFLPGFSPAQGYLESEWENEKPPRKPYCAGCPYREILAAFREEAEAVGQNPFFTGDPGCVVMAANKLDTKLCMGSAIGAAVGLERAGVSERAVAFLGDSSFYHSALNALIHARSTDSKPLVVILDNGGAVTTGTQVTPDSGVRLPGGGKGPHIGIEDLTRACGVDSIRIVEEEDSEQVLRDRFREALLDEKMGMLIVKKKCKPVP